MCLSHSPPPASSVNPVGLHDIYLADVWPPVLMAWTILGSHPDIHPWMLVRSTLASGEMPSAEPFLPTLPSTLAPATMAAMDAFVEVPSAVLDAPWLTPRAAMEAVCWAALRGQLHRPALINLAAAGRVGHELALPYRDPGTALYYRALILGDAAHISSDAIAVIQTAAHPEAREWGARQLERLARLPEARPRRRRRRRSTARARTRSGPGLTPAR